MRALVYTIMLVLSLLVAVDVFVKVVKSELQLGSLLRGKKTKDYLRALVIGLAVGYFTTYILGKLFEPTPAFYIAGIVFGLVFTIANLEDSGNDTPG